MSNWVTADGTVLVFEELTQSHLSNIFWYHLLVSPNLNTRVVAINALDKRGKTDSAFIRLEKHSVSDWLMDYQPVSQKEIEFLKQKGYVTPQGEIHDVADILA